jgi:hypothetical protein
MGHQTGLRAAPATRQHGQFIILTVLIVALGTGFLVYSMAEFRSIDSKKNAKTDRALALAREALLGRALSDDLRPGSLPCPDVDDDGQLTLSVDYGGGGTCTRYIGRLPWKTLGLPELRDGDGEHLWYALSPAFMDATGNAVNTDSIGSITAYSSCPTNPCATASALSTRAVAVVFSPGAPIGTQARSPSVALAAPCLPMTATAIPQSLCANNYLDLDTISGINNANASGPYISVPAKATFNDRLLVVSDSVDLMTQIESRAAQAILSALQAYRAGSKANSSRFCYPVGCYPWADVSNGNANDGLLYGRVPLMSANTGGDNNDWSDAGVTIPTWLTTNKWWLVFFYAVDANDTINHDPFNSFSALTVDSAPGPDIVLISAGAATTPRVDFPDDYIDDAANKNYSINSNFVTPADTTSTNRDRLYSLP